MEGGREGRREGEREGGGEKGRKGYMKIRVCSTLADSVQKERKRRKEPNPVT